MSTTNKLNKTIDKTINKTIDKHYEAMIKTYIQYKKSAHSRIIKKLYYSTHLKGPHIDFFNSPPSLNKIELFDNLKKFQKKIVTSIGYLIHCEKAQCYLNVKVVEAMIEQIKIIEQIDQHYWENFGFVESDIEIIQKTYQIYKLFLETYLIRVSKNKTQIKSKLYEACLFENFGAWLDPLKLQIFGLARIEQLVKEIQSQTLKEPKKESKKIKSDTELFSLMMTNILTLYNENNKKSNVVHPEPHKIKIKQTSLLFEKFNYSSIVSGRYIFINDLNPQMYTRDDIMLICAHDSIGGIMTTKLNIKDKIQSYTKPYFIKNPQDKQFRNAVKKMFTNLPYYNEGLACMSEKNVALHIYDNLSLLTKQLVRVVSMVVDIGLHYDAIGDNTLTTFDLISATNYIKQITHLSDTEINAILLKILASPASSCTQEFARYVMSKYKLELEHLGYDFYDTIYCVPLNITAMANLLLNLKQNK